MQLQMFENTYMRCGRGQFGNCPSSSKMGKENTSKDGSKRTKLIHVDTLLKNV